MARVPGIIEGAAHSSMNQRYADAGLMSSMHVISETVRPSSRNWWADATRSGVWTLGRQIQCPLARGRLPVEGAFNGQGALEPRQFGEQVQFRTTHCRRCADRLMEAAKTHLVAAESVDNADRMRQRPT